MARRGGGLLPLGFTGMGEELEPRAGQAASSQHSATEPCRAQAHAQILGDITPSFHLPSMGNNPTHRAVHMARRALSRLSPASLCLQDSSAHTFPVSASVTAASPRPS